MPSQCDAFLHIIEKRGFRYFSNVRDEETRNKSRCVLSVWHMRVCVRVR